MGIRENLIRSCEQRLIDRDYLIAVLTRARFCVNSTASIVWGDPVTLGKRRNHGLMSMTSLKTSPTIGEGGFLTGMDRGWMDNPRYKAEVFLSGMIEVLETNKGVSPEGLKVAIAGYLAKCVQQDPEVNFSGILTSIGFWKLLEEVFFRETLTDQRSLSMGWRVIFGSVRTRLRSALRPELVKDASA